MRFASARARDHFARRRLRHEFQVSLKDLSYRLGFRLNGAATGNRGSDRGRHNHHQCSAFGKELGVPPGISDFVKGTLQCAIHGSVVEFASYFFFGREDVIPEMFNRLLKLLNHGAIEVPYFAYYLKRHIELDGESHGPWAREMLMTLAGQDESSWKQAASPADRAITSRIKLWDCVLAHLKNG